MQTLREHLSTGVLLEITSVALHGILYPFGMKPRAVKSSGPGKTRPVILIHGYGHNRSAFLPLEVYLRAVGFDRIFPFGYANPPGIVQVAESLRTFVDQVRESCASGKQTVDLVAHSLGGLAARVYLQELGGARHVDQCITLATPHYGTYSSYWAPTAVGREMRPESEFMARLNDPAKRASGVRYYSLWAEQDLMVLPRENAIYQEGDDQSIGEVGHFGIVLHPKSLRQSAHKLRAGQDIPATRVERISRLASGVLGKGISLIRSKKD
jgi:triacylglycerol esterase/lipase EstA (alpha/beta hydrolase family)